MDISAYISEYKRKRRYSSLYDTDTAKKILFGDSKSAFVQQPGYTESEYLAYNIRESVKKNPRNKVTAIRVYKDFVEFLKQKKLPIEVEFPPVSIGNDFERLMFIAKYLQTPSSKVSSLPDILWVDKRTIDEDMAKLRGDDEKSIKICGKMFRVDYKRKKDEVNFPSTAHPLFLTPNISQVLVTLKGLKALSNDPLYENYARTFAADIWEQLSDYAKDRIHFVLSKLLPEDLAWYESLNKKDLADDEEDEEEYLFYSERRCSVRNNVQLEAIKNDKPFHVLYQDEKGTCVYDNCIFIQGTFDGKSYEVNCTQGRVRLYFDKIISSAYTAEELF